MSNEEKKTAAEQIVTDAKKAGWTVKDDGFSVRISVPLKSTRTGKKTAAKV